MCISPRSGTRGLQRLALLKYLYRGKKFSLFLHKRPYKIRNTHNGAICHDKLSENILVIEIEQAVYDKCLNLFLLVDYRIGIDDEEICAEWNENR